MNCPRLATTARSVVVNRLGPRAPCRVGRVNLGKLWRCSGTSRPASASRSCRPTRREPAGERRPPRQAHGNLLCGQERAVLRLSPRSRGLRRRRRREAGAQTGDRCASVAGDNWSLPFQRAPAAPDPGRPSERITQDATTTATSTIADADEDPARRERAGFAVVSSSARRCLFHPDARRPSRCCYSMTSSTRPASTEVPATRSRP